MLGRVLVIDDDPDTCGFLLTALTHAGFEVETRLDGPSALASFRTNPHDVVITDIRMPEMDGLEVLRNLKAIDPDVGVIIVSATVEDRTGIAIDAMRGGATDYFIKPLSDRAELERAVANAVRRRAARREQVKALHELEQRARTDPLTGLANRLELEQRLREEFSRVGRGGEEFSLAVFDVDSFKTINDTYGHLFGDTVLKSVADALRENCRAYDVKARYGGDEFVVVMPYTNLEQGVAVVEKIRRAVLGLGLSINGSPLRLTLSAGVTSTVGREGLSPEALIRRADLALYEAKSTGRNQTVPLARGEPAAEVLVVENRPDEAESLVRLCETLGCRADWASTGEEALRRVEELKYALVLMDASTPGIDPESTLGRIKASSPATTTALLADTESDGARPGGAGSTSGASARIHVRRPVSVDSLRGLLAGARKKAHAP